MINNLSANEDFLAKLHSQAKKQAQLEKRRFLPKKLDWFGSLVGNYPWQVILIASGLTAMVIEVVRLK